VLVELHIENLGVIERADVVFGEGLTALTGETGAGKTILVEAIELLVGGRADSSIVRHGANEARIDARLIVPAPDGHAEIVLSRVVPVSGRSRAYVDGRPATVSSLAERTRGLIDLHGQHAHQSLLSTRTQRSSLDSFGSVDLGALSAARARVTEIEAELATLGGDERSRVREIDLLRFHVAELDAAGLDDPEEDERLALEERILADAVAHSEAGIAAFAALRDEGGADDSITLALRTLGDREPYQDVVARLSAAAAELNDAATRLRETAEGIEEDPGRLEIIRQRRQLLSDLRRKFGADLSEVMAFHAETAERLTMLERYDERAASLDSARRAAIDAVRAAARAVGEHRRTAAPRLAQAVEARLRELAMPGASVSIEVGSGIDDEAGDHVVFLLAADPGSPLLPLQRVASGGELARAMLALRLVLAGVGHGEGASTLVFDEVDAGIGGSAAVAVGAELAALGEHHQVLVVTHLPQVAANATNHFTVTKSVDGDVTTTAVERADHDARIDEIARMLAGDNNRVARDHARDLLER